MCAAVLMRSRRPA